MAYYKLTIKQANFVKLFADKTSKTYGNATKSYIAAGYKDSPNAMYTACHLMQNSKVKQAIAEYQQKLDEKQTTAEITGKEYTIQRAKEHLERCIESKDNTNTSSMIKLFAQINGLLIDRKEIEQTNHNIANITPQELEALEAIARANNIRLSQKQG